MCVFNYKVADAVDGIEALTKLSEHVFDLVLMDVHVPVVDGIRTMQIMKGEGIPLLLWCSPPM